MLKKYNKIWSNEIGFEWDLKIKWLLWWKKEYKEKTIYDVFWLEIPLSTPWVYHPLIIECCLEFFFFFKWTVNFSERWAVVILTFSISNRPPPSISPLIIANDNLFAKSALELTLIIRRYCWSIQSVTITAVSAIWSVLKTNKQRVIPTRFRATYPVDLGFITGVL